MRAEGGEEITRREESKSHGGGNRRTHEGKRNAFQLRMRKRRWRAPPLLFGRKGRIHVRFVSPTPLHTDSGIRHIFVSEEKHGMI